MKTRVLATGLHFPEGPRWRDGSLYFSDMHGDVVQRLDPASGELSVVAEVDHPSGLGWLPDGRMLVVTMEKQQVLRQEADGSLVVHADISSIATADANDMLVDGQGRAYVGNFGGVPSPDEWPDFTPTPARLALVTPDGAVSEAASETLLFPNGMALTPDGSTLIVAETFASGFSAFDVAADGGLGNRRVWATVEGSMPDGICLDAEGCIWFASATGAPGEVIRVREGGEVLERIETQLPAYACMLGGADGKTLFICTAQSPVPDDCRNNPGACIEVVDVSAPRAGLP
jgi:sugar lactone lactonase YvrE